MPDIYRSGDYIPEMRGVVRGGATIVIHDSNDVHALRAWCALVGQPPAPPMAALHAAISAPNFDLNGWETWWRRRGPLTLTDWREVTTDPHEDDPIELLSASLSLAQTVWTADDEEERSKLCLALSVPDPALPPHVALEMETQAAALVFHQGSLVSRILVGGVKPVGFVISILVGGGVAPVRRSERLHERLRAKFQGKPGVYPLKDIRTITSNDLKEKRGLVVFVHGLLSTDLGTFDGLISRLHANLAFAGFPHDTLRTIGSNGMELAEILLDRVASAAIPVVFVAHSRGGLVARHCAIELYKVDQTWKDQLRGCVTFGTPHKGAVLAESPDDLIGLFVMAAGTTGPRRIASLVDTLLYRSQTNRFPGIEDLRPRVRGDEFLEGLENAETAKRTLKIFAFGGKVQPVGVRGWITERLLGVADHDLVVETTSSLPTFVSAANQRKLSCDHFSYFQDAQGASLQEAANFIADALRLQTQAPQPRNRFGSKPSITVKPRPPSGGGSGEKESEPGSPK